MRFMMLYEPGRESTAPSTEIEMAEMGELIQEMVSEGVLLTTDGLLPSAMGARVRMEGEKFVVTDGPFAETRELVAGYAIVQVESKAAVIELAKRFLRVVGEGVSEIRQMHGDSALPIEVLQTGAAKAS